MKESTPKNKQFAWFEGALPGIVAARQEALTAEVLKLLEGQAGAVWAKSWLTKAILYEAVLAQNPDTNDAKGDKDILTAAFGANGLSCISKEIGAKKYEGPSQQTAA